jgi:hypothetical protein
VQAMVQDKQNLTGEEFINLVLKVAIVKNPGVCQELNQNDSETIVIVLFFILNMADARHYNSSRQLFLAGLNRHFIDVNWEQVKNVGQKAIELAHFLE